MARCLGPFSLGSRLREFEFDKRHEKKLSFSPPARVAVARENVAPAPPQRGLGRPRAMRLASVKLVPCLTLQEFHEFSWLVRVLKKAFE
jgi:hypothetical protein